MSDPNIDDRMPSLSPDGKTLYFTRPVPTDDAGDTSDVIYVATRASLTDAFGTPVVATAVGVDGPAPRPDRPPFINVNTTPTNTIRP